MSVTNVADNVPHQLKLSLDRIKDVISESFLLAFQVWRMLKQNVINVINVSESNAGDLFKMNKEPLFVTFQ